MIEESEIEKNLKKYLTNTINSCTNKKVFKNESKIDELMDKTNNIIKLLNNINDRIEKIEKVIFSPHSNEMIDINNNINTNNYNNNNYKNNNINNNEEEIIQKPLTKSDSNIELLKKMNEIISNDSDTEKDDYTKDDYIKNDKNVEKKKALKSKKQKTPTDTLLTKYVDIKVKHFDIDEKIVKKCLNMNSTNGDIQLFKKMYIENVSKEYIPIRHIKKKFQYWINDHMQDDDTGGEYIVSTVLKNIELCYMKINTMDNYGDDIDQFLKNQEHINRLHDPKYKERILVLIINLVDI